MLFVPVPSSDTFQNSCPQRSQALLGMVLSIDFTTGGKGQVYSQQLCLGTTSLVFLCPRLGNTTPDSSLEALNFSKSIILPPFYR